jgi:hypothetical protein
MRKTPLAGCGPDRRAGAALLVASAICLGATVATAAALPACAALGPSCDTSDQGNPADPYRGGTIEGDTYMTSPWTGPLLNYSGGKRYELMHELGCVPREIDVWVAFSEDGIRSGNISPCAGNMCVIQAVDEHKILIKNDTCSDFFLMVAATCRRGDGGATDGGGADAADATADAGGP